MPSKLEKKLLQRCKRCRLRPTLCLCLEFPRLELQRTQLTLIIHRQEGKSTTNTGLLAAEILPQSSVLWRGGKEAGQVHESGGEIWLSKEELFIKGSMPLFLFPDAQAETVNREWLERELREDPLRRFNLIVPDGTWGQASRVGRREPALSGVRRVKLDVGPLSEYRLRREHDDQHVCTFEAIARLLGVLEGPEVQQKLEVFFRKFVGRQLWGAGKLVASEVPGGIPSEAIHERQVSGFPRKW